MDSGLVTLSGDAKTMLDDPKVRATYLGKIGSRSFSFSCRQWIIVSRIPILQ
jgi:hypothetical protein